MFNNAQIRYQIKKLKDYLALKTEMVDHRAVIRDVASGVERCGAAGEEVQ